MLFAEKMNHHTYFGATTLGGNPSALPPMDMTASWKPVGQSSNEFNPIYNDSSSGAGRAGYGSKLITIWRHQDYNNGNQIDQPTIINSAGSSTYAPAAANFPGFHNTGCWNDSQQQTLFHQMPPQYDQMSFQQTEAKFAGNQWGKVEIDQTNPWNLENNAAVIHDQSFHPQQQPQPPSQSYRYNRNNKWDQQAPLRDEGISNSGFSTNIYATTPPYGMVQTFGFGDNRLIPSNGQRGNGGPSQLWAEGSGSTIPAPIVKLGGCEMLNVLPHNNTGPPPHQPHQQHRGQPQMRAGVNGTIFTAGPPPMNIAPPPSSRPLSNHPSHLIPAHMVGPPPAPTPLLSSLNQQSTHSIGNFGGESVSVSMHIQDSLPPNGPNNNMQSEQIDDAYWHWQDPNSQLRKWKHDTGITIWGDPIKQSNIPIKRWTNFTSDEVVAEVVPGGWGELPPFGSNVNNNTNSNSNNENNDNNNNSNDASVNSNVPQHFDTQAQPLNNQQQTNQNNSLPERDWSTGTAILPQQHNQQLQSFNKNGIISGGNGQFYGGIPPTSSENPVSTTGQTSFYQQPPSLFSSTVMDPLNTNLDADLQSSGGTGSVEPISRKATVSPSDGNNAFGGGIRQSQQATQCQQNNKVSLVDELSSLTPHGPGGGSYW